MPLSADLRYAARGLARSPAPTLAAIVCLGLGIGATTAIYSAVHAALLRPLPFSEPERLVTVYRTTPHSQTWPFSPANFLDLRRETRSLERLVAVGQTTFLMHGVGDPARVTANRASDGLFAMLGTRPLLGRTLRDGEEDPAQPAVVLLSESLWRERFGADADVVGSTLRLDGVEHEVVGVLPRGFRVPHGPRFHESDIWVPLRFEPEQLAQRRNNSLNLIGQLAAGSDVDAADSELRAIMDRIVASFPELRGEQLRVLPLHAESVRVVRGPLLLLLSAVGFVLLIAVANVASLLLARGVSRGGEFALRTVLGARGAAVVRPAMAESIVLTGAGAALGVVLSWVGVQAIRAIIPRGLPHLQTIALEPVVLVFAIAISAIVAITCGIAPALQAAASQPQDALRSSGRTGSSRRHQRFLRTLVGVEVALSLVLLLGAGLVLRGFQNLVRSDPGFDPEPLLTLNVDIASDRYAEGATYESFLLPVLERIRAVPGVRAAGAISLVPYINWGWNSNTRYEGQGGEDPTRLPVTENRVVAHGFFETLDMQLVRGRLFTRADDNPDAPVAVIANEALVRRDFPDSDPIGKRFHLGDTVFATIVGVVRDIRNVGPISAPYPEFYYNWGQWSRAATSFPLMVKVDGDPTAAAQPIMAAIREADETAAISGVQTMPVAIAQSVGGPRFYLVLIAVFALVALVLASAGLYGVMSYAVAQRTREIGIRSALGSTPSRTVAFVLGQGAFLVVGGGLVGLLAGAGLTRLLQGALYGVSPLDPLTWGMVLATLVAAAFLAILIPAARAARIDPIRAMRTD